MLIKSVFSYWLNTDRAPLRERGAIEMKRARLNLALSAALVASVAVGIASAREVSVSHIAGAGDLGFTDTVQHDSPERMRAADSAR
jgi:hypothetical protein